MHVLVDFFHGVVGRNFLVLSFTSFDLVDDFALVGQHRLRSDLLAGLGQVVRLLADPRFAAENDRVRHASGELLCRNSDLKKVNTQFKELFFEQNSTNRLSLNLLPYLLILYFCHFFNSGNFQIKYSNNWFKSTRLNSSQDVQVTQQSYKIGFFEVLY